MPFMKTGFVLLVLACSAPANASTVGTSGFSLQDLAKYLGSYRLQATYRGSCPSSLNVGLGQIGNEKEGYSTNPNVLDIGGYSFTAFNSGWQEFDNGDTWSRRRADQSVSLFSRLPVLKGKWEKRTRSSGLRVKREVEIQTRADGMLIVEIESAATGRGHANAKCLFSKVQEAPMPSQKNQGK